MKRLFVIRALFCLVLGLGTIFAATAAASAAPYGTTTPRLGVLQPGPCAGSSMSTSGRGFTPGESVTVSRNGVAVGTVVANSAGDFSYAVSLVGVPAGSYTISAVGASSKTPASTAVTVRSAACSGVGQTTTVSRPTTPGTTTSAAGLAFTGVQVAAMSIFAAVVLAGGVLLVVLGRRRRT